MITKSLKDHSKIAKKALCAALQRVKHLIDLYGFDNSAEANEETLPRHEHAQSFRGLLTQVNVFDHVGAEHLCPGCALVTLNSLLPEPYKNIAGMALWTVGKSKEELMALIDQLLEMLECECVDDECASGSCSTT